MIKLAIKITIALVTLLSMIACEDVVDIELETATPKLVIDASIKWEKETTGNEQTIRLTTTGDYYGLQVPVVSGAVVTIKNGIDTYDFIEEIGTGNYNCTNFNPIINGVYTLTVLYKGEIYTATDTLYATPNIDYVEQSLLDTGFGDPNIQVKFFYQDNGSEDNYYLVGFKNKFVSFPEYGTIEDKFFQGNQMFGLYIDEDLKPNYELKLSLQGISINYFNYMTKLLSIAGTNGGNPFGTTPVTLRGNIVNQTNPDNFPFGYFSLGEIDTDTYIIE